jgi:hypothetical protein
VILRHNEIRDELADLAAKAFSPSAIRNEPLIHSSCPAVKMPVLAPALQFTATCIRTEVPTEET